MHGLVLAGGDGSRLHATGVTVAKALVPVAGTPQVARMVSACRRVGCDSVTCAVREDLADAVRSAVGDSAVRVVPLRLPTSLHTLEAALREIPAGDVLATLVDTVMPDRHWDAAHMAAAAELRRADAVVVVTPFVEDEKPLWVDLGPNGDVQAFGARGARELVTGGVYWLSDAARSEATAAVADGVERLRGYLTRLIARGMRVRAVEVPKIVDIDTRADLIAAAQLLAGADA